MKSVSELIEIQELLQRLRAVLQARRYPGPATDPQLCTQLARTEALLTRVEAGLYPDCEVCGDHIDLAQLRRSPLAVTCRRCTLDATHHALDGVSD